MKPANRKIRGLLFFRWNKITVMRHENALIGDIFMQHSFRVSLAVALAATSLPTLICVPVSAQPRLEPRPMREVVLPTTQIESIDAAAKTVSLRSLQLAPGTKPTVTEQGGTQIQMVPGGLEIIPIAAGAPVVRLEAALSSDALKIGDIVSLLAQKADPGKIKVTLGAVEPLPFVAQLMPAILQRTGGARYNSKAEFFWVVALAPLTLRKGGEPMVGQEDNVLSVPFTNGPASLPIGTVSVGISEGSINLKMQRGNEEGADTPIVVANYIATLKLDKVEGLEFDRFTPLKLDDVAADFKAGKVNLSPEFGQSPGGKREITRLVVASRN